MTHYLMSFPAGAMRHLSPQELQTAGDAAHRVIRDAKAAGVYVFAGGLDDAVGPARIAGDGTSAAGAYPETERLDGGFCVMKLPTRAAAEHWAARIAAACQCAQELRAFMHDPEC